MGKDWPIPKFKSKVSDDHLKLAKAYADIRKACTALSHVLDEQTELSEKRNKTYGFGACDNAHGLQRNEACVGTRWCGMWS